ncbi:hypothetical protein Acy02nite_47340 [Actinoplanes cyaneus]|uniref:EF-hand domain-containing protein n=1 Tax=Actinoplanes cyaneus TaxID=52696 RepID=A0A919INY3_9ACTN|nr:hypothetical protein [Actinoplanes cyaneus]GID66853.1 hypothetical protein Acy02nite_47340 [Actinoplanes cyaneus]
MIQATGVLRRWWTGAFAGTTVVVTAGLLFTTASSASAAPCPEEGIAQTVLTNFTGFDTAAQHNTPDGRISLDDLAAAADPRNHFPAELGAAANYLINHQDLFHQMETAAQGGRGDGILSRDDLRAYLGGDGCG